MKNNNIYATAINALVGKTRAAYRFRAEKWNLNRARAARYMAFVFYSWRRYERIHATMICDIDIIAKNSDERAYNNAIRAVAVADSDGKKKRGFCDADIADLLNTALLAIISNTDDIDDYTVACRAIDNAMTALHDDRRTVTTEKELMTLCAHNIRDMKRAAATNQELKDLFNDIITDNTDMQIVDLLSSGNSHREIARILDMPPRTVDYRVKRLNKHITAAIVSNSTYSKYLA